MSLSGVMGKTLVQWPSGSGDLVLLAAFKFEIDHLVKIHYWPVLSWAQDSSYEEWHCLDTVLITLYWVVWFQWSIKS